MTGIGIPTFKIVVVGDAAVGKTTFVNKLSTGKFETKYVQSPTVEINPIIFNTSKGSICFNLWNCPGHEKYNNFNKLFYSGADAAIIMFACNDRNSYKSIVPIYNDMRCVCGNIQTVLCGNKCDKNNRKVKMVNFHKRKNNMTYCDLSIKLDHNFHTPFLTLARYLMGDPELIMVIDCPPNI